MSRTGTTPVSQTCPEASTFELKIRLCIELICSATHGRRLQDRSMGVKKVGVSMPSQTHRSDFVRRIFAIIVSVGFAGAIAASPWVANERLPQRSEIGPLLCLLSGLILVISSWEGYHRHSEKTDDRLSIFVTDLILLFVYLPLLLLSDAPNLLLWLVAIVFGLYAVWDFQVFLYYKPVRGRTQFFISSLWCAGFIAMTNVWHSTPGAPLWAAYTVSTAAILFRIPKLRTIPRTVAAIVISCGPYIAFVIAEGSSPIDTIKAPPTQRQQSAKRGQEALAQPTREEGQTGRAPQTPSLEAPRK